MVLKPSGEQCPADARSRLYGVELASGGAAAVVDRHFAYAVAVFGYLGEKLGFKVESGSREI